ncbi:uncharacterized protein [Littorina saxatilis]|uniref:uncharacterized protein n=1 Tax=Littorina saxatilis TaxID=31220 RepID=UPI0038B41F79
MYTIAECNLSGNIDIVFNKTTSLACTGLGPGRTVLWSMKVENKSTARVLGQCAPCEQAPCANCTFGNDGYPITRKPTKTTIDLTISGTNDTFSIICLSDEEPPLSANCTVNVIEMLPIDTVERDHSLSTIAAVRVGVGVAVVVLFAVLVALIVMLKRTDSTYNDHIPTHGARVKTKHNDMYADNPAHNKEPDTIISVQLTDVPSTSQTACSANRTDVPTDTDAYTYIEVDLVAAEEKKISQTAGANARRVLFFKHAPADKMATCRELDGSADEDHCNNAEIDSLMLANTCLGSQRAETAADAYG